jgi:hypothetical protein
MTAFCEIEPTLENYWRGIVLFGRNVASYKFAMAKSLLELSSKGETFVTLDDLAKPFSRYLVEHVKTGNKQATSKSSRVLDACKQYSLDAIPETELLDVISRLGFNNVIDAFHVVNNENIPFRFFEDERQGTRKGIRLTDEIYKLKDLPFSNSLEPEVEARWKLVETAWELKISRSLVTVSHDLATERLFVTKAERRRDVTSSRDALNGYQRGKCFYCYDSVSISPGSPSLAEVDHFFPHLLKGMHAEGITEPIDGVWNLVLACRECNGSGQKGTKVPTKLLLERLNKRNEYLIESNHPLKETIILQTGSNAKTRGAFLNRVWSKATGLLLFNWEPESKGDPTF